MWLWNEWFNPNSFYSYCVIVPFISGILIYQKIRAVGFKIKELFFPLCFLIFMFPLPIEWTVGLTFHLKFLSAQLSTMILNGLLIHAVQQGNVIQLPHGAVVVNDACSGIRAILSLFAMGTVFAYWMRTGLRKKVFLLLAVFPIAMFVNSVRICFLAMVTEFWGAKHTVGLIHDAAGFLLFGLAFLMLILTKKELELNS